MQERGTIQFPPVLYMYVVLAFALNHLSRRIPGIRDPDQDLCETNERNPNPNPVESFKSLWMMIVAVHRTQTAQSDCKTTKIFLLPRRRGCFRNLA